MSAVRGEKPPDTAARGSRAGTCLDASTSEMHNDKMPESGTRNESMDKHSEEAITANAEPEVIDFEDGDPENPTNWPARKKWLEVVLVSLMNVLGIIATTTIIPAVPQALAEFHVDNSQLYQILLVSVWELGERIGPFIIAPLSARFGRLPVYHIGNALALIFAAAGALSTSISMLVATRFLAGSTMTALILAPAIIGDIFAAEQCGSAMAITMGLQILGAGVAPIAGSFVAQAASWRWSIWIAVIGMGTVAVLSLAFVRETYAVAILERRASRLCRETGNQRLRSKHAARLSVTSFVLTISRPVRMLCLSPVVLIVSFYQALTYGLSYLVLTTLTEILESRYDFRYGVVGLGFLGLVAGNVLGMVLYGLVSDRYIRYKKEKEGGELRPEHRLVIMVVAGAVLPLGFLLYGWTLAYQLHWMAPHVSTAIIGFSVVLSILPSENYLVDVYEIHGASAIAAGVILRAFFGALFPLVGPPLYDRLDLGWGNSVLALVALAVMPMVLLLWRCGPRLRTEKLLQDR